MKKAKKYPFGFCVIIIMCSAILFGAAAASEPFVMLKTLDPEQLTEEELAHQIWLWVREYQVTGVSMRSMKTVDQAKLMHKVQPGAYNLQALANEHLPIKYIILIEAAALAPMCLSMLPSATETCARVQVSLDEAAEVVFPNGVPEQVVMEGD